MACSQRTGPHTRSRVTELTIGADSMTGDVDTPLRGLNQHAGERNCCGHRAAKLALLPRDNLSTNSDDGRNLIEFDGVLPVEKHNI